MRSVTSPPSRTRRHSAVVGEATQMAPSSSRQMPSGVAPPRSAQMRRPESEPSSPMSNAVSCRAKVSATTSVLPSGMMTDPFGNARSSATTTACPFGSTRTSDAVLNCSPPPKSNPKLPMYARPCASTTMSFASPPTYGEISATSRNPKSRSSTSSRWSAIETTSNRPSSRNPSPDGLFGTSQMTEVWPPGSSVITRRSCMSENQSRPSYQRGPSGNFRPSRTTVGEG